MSPSVVTDVVSPQNTSVLFSLAPPLSPQKAPLSPHQARRLPVSHSHTRRQKYICTYPPPVAKSLLVSQHQHVRVSIGNNIYHELPAYRKNAYLSPNISTCLQLLDCYVHALVVWSPRLDAYLISIPNMSPSVDTEVVSPPSKQALPSSPRWHPRCLFRKHRFPPTRPAVSPSPHHTPEDKGTTSKKGDTLEKTSTTEPQSISQSKTTFLNLTILMS